MLTWLYKSLDAVITAPLNPKARKRDLALSVVKRRSSNYNRVASFLNLLDGFVPGIARKTGRSLLNLERFPFAGYSVDLLAYGSGATVYLLQKGADRKVLKVFRRSLGKTPGGALQVAREYQSKYQNIAAWFNGRFQIAVPCLYLLLNGPLLGVSCVGLVQPYVEGKKFDLFEDFTEDEAVQLGKEDIHFREQLLDFSQKLFAVAGSTGMCFDIVGRENLMLVDTGHGIRIKIVDNGIFDLAAVRERSPNLYSRIQDHLERLRAIQMRLEEQVTQ